MNRRRLFFNSRSPLPLGIQNDDDAKLFADELLPGERKMLFDRLRKITADQYNEHKQVTEVTIHHDDLRKIWNINFVPMFVYGILDEAFLIIGGDTINYIFNIYNGMSMLASAAVANIAVNMFLQIPVDRSLHWFAIKKPVLSTDQMNTIEFKRVTWSARLTGLWLGLTLGMIPLFYLDDNMDRRMIEREIDWYLATGDRKRMLESHEYCDLKELREESVGSKINIIANKNGVNFEE